MLLHETIVEERGTKFNRIRSRTFDFWSFSTLLYIVTHSTQFLVFLSCDAARLPSQRVHAQA